MQQWLYGSKEGVNFRRAPSLIVRSEAELFGISSPRFAIRASFGGHGFINVRRRAHLKEMIERTFEQQASKDPLIESLKENVHMWIADSLLEPPPRLVDPAREKKQYEILSVELDREYGEHIGKKLTPFVSFISIGGGLCAQAACFTVLCLAQSDPIHSISEITKLAARPGVARLHGLDAPSITKFLASDHVSVNAQLQTISKVDVGKDARRFYLHALKSYIRNGVPVIALVSSNRMKGCGMRNSNQKPILTANGLTFDPNDYSKIPIGFYFENDPNTGLPIGSKIDNHCVVVVGVNDEDSFCIHDTATFPFLEATIDQLIDAGANGNYKRNNGEVEARTEILDLEDPEIKEQFAELTPPQFIAVTPEGVKTPLLDFTESFDKIVEELGKDPEFNFQGILRTAIDNQQMHAKSVEELSLDPNFGEFFLANLVDPVTGKFVSKRDGLPEFPAQLISKLSPGWYWIQAVDHPVERGARVPTFWFWFASDLEINRDEAMLVLRNFKNSWDILPELS